MSYPARAEGVGKYDNSISLHLLWYYGIEQSFSVIFSYLLFTRLQRDTDSHSNIYIYIYICYHFHHPCHAISFDILDLFSPHLPIPHCFQQILRATSRIGTELLYVGSGWTSCFCSCMERGPQEYITYELVPTSPAVTRVSVSSNLDSFRYGW